MWSVLQCAVTHQVTSVENIIGFLNFVLRENKLEESCSQQTFKLSTTAKKVSLSNTKKKNAIPQNAKLTRYMTEGLGV